MQTTNFTIKGGYGKYTYLDRIYRNFLNQSLINIDEDTIQRWQVYDSIMSELLELGKVKMFEEIKYRFTGGEDPNEVMIDIMTRDPEIESILSYYIRKIQQFIDDDLMERFLG